MGAVMPRKQFVFLTGFSGSGKSTVGAMLAARLGMRFVDLDVVIEKRAGCSITELFARGEGAFRKLEAAAFKRVTDNARNSAVIALGGGALLHPATLELATTLGTLVYLSCDARRLYTRLRAVSDRPLLAVRLRPGETIRAARMRRIKALLNKRLPGYRRAHIMISTTQRTPDETTRELVNRLRKYHDHA